MITPKKKRNSRTAGHRYELTVMHWFRSIGFPHLVTSRSESRSRDNQKIDLINQNESVTGRFPYDVQCKNVCKPLKYKEILDEIKPTKNVIRVIFHKLTAKADVKFVHQGHYAILSAEDFLKMAARLKQLEDAETGRVTAMVPTLDRQKVNDGIY